MPSARVAVALCVCDSSGDGLWLCELRETDVVGLQWLLETRREDDHDAVRVNRVIVSEGDGVIVRLGECTPDAETDTDDSFDGEAERLSVSDLAVDGDDELLSEVLGLLRLFDVAMESLSLSLRDAELVAVALGAAFDNDTVPLVELESVSEALEKGVCVIFEWLSERTLEGERDNERDAVKADDKDAREAEGVVERVLDCVTSAESDRVVERLRSAAEMLCELVPDGVSVTESEIASDKERDVDRRRLCEGPREDVTELVLERDWVGEAETVGDEDSVREAVSSFESEKCERDCDSEGFSETLFDNERDGEPDQLGESETVTEAVVLLSGVLLEEGFDREKDWPMSAL